MCQAAHLLVVHIIIYIHEHLHHMIQVQGHYADVELTTKSDSCFVAKTRNTHRQKKHYMRV